MPLVPCQKTLEGTGSNKDRRVDTEFGPYKVIIQRHLADVVDMETFKKKSVKMFPHNENSGQNVTTENYIGCFWYLYQDTFEVNGTPEYNNVK
jgi:hypothetical protein